MGNLLQTIALNSHGRGHEFESRRADFPFYLLAAKREQAKRARNVALPV